jgi:superfamily II DNA/RNA helicase
MWPAIKLGLNVVAISSKASGKTVGYTIPIINCIAVNKEVCIIF